MNKNHGYYIKKRPVRKKKLFTADERRISRYFFYSDVSLRAVTVDLHVNVLYMTIQCTIKKNPEPPTLINENCSSSHGRSQAKSTQTSLEKPSERLEK
ncbi:hypothetical protein WR25_08944 [Diploscapter pachys]|uniref:Uncharacterized protein n=1 Tax=Diploscapter pachys TaxID=2018661 RepID=A0A2A2L3B0_9BILA|nr:hypothetical protein WR25_08944 [Diploscapter pachys]